MAGKLFWVPSMSGVLTAVVFALTIPAEQSMAAAQDSPPKLVREWSVGLWKPRGGPTATTFAGLTDDEYSDPDGPLGTNPIPYNAEYSAIYRRVRAAAAKGTNELDYGSRCLLYGMPSVMDGSVLEFVFEPKRVYIIVEEQGGVRRIWLDGRERPSDMERTYNGFSVGHWEGQTLAVTTTHLRVDSILDTGSPHSDAMSITERISPEGPDGMKDEVTVTDPKALIRPWTATAHYEHHRDWVMQERVCAENNRTENSDTDAPGTLKGVQK